MWNASGETEGPRKSVLAPALARAESGSEELFAALDAVIKREKKWRAGGVPKQLLVRKALEALSEGEWATNTTPSRILIGRLLDRWFKERKSIPKFTSAASARPVLPCFTELINSSSSMESSHMDVTATKSTNTDTAILFPKADEKSSTLATLDKEGIVVVHSVIKDSTLARVQREFCSSCNAGKSTKYLLRESTGNGRNGEYLFFEPGPQSPLMKLRAKLTEFLTLDERASRRSQFLALRYGEGGQNFLHSDPSEEKFQALLLLSRFGVDFDGGEMYVKHIDWPKDREKKIQWKGAGDLVIFKSKDGWAHGMKTVSKGSGETCHRFAVGLLQPPKSDTKKKRKAN